MFNKLIEGFGKKTLSYFLNKNKNFLIFYNSLNIKLFDVTLRDGIQNANPKNFSLEKKISLFNEIKNNYNPTYFEIGAFVSRSKLPIFNDTQILYESLKDKSNSLFIFVPTRNLWQKTCFDHNAHLSFVTSTSNKFQIHNIGKSISQSTDEINIISRLSKNNNPNLLTKLYITCIDECPFSGAVDINRIINLILYYSSPLFDYNIIMLSDTCGSLTFEIFKQIIDGISKNSLISFDKLGLHLHVHNENEVQKIIHYAIKCKIVIFDVSLMEFGGCTTGLHEKDRHANLSYDQFFKYIINYVLMETKQNA